MSSVATAYSRNSFPAEDQSSLIARIAQEKQRLENARVEQAKPGASDTAVFTDASNSVPEDLSAGLADAVKKRIAAMVQASKETAEETAELEKLKAGREERNSLSDAGESAALADEKTTVGQEINPVSAKTARTLASYARTASSFSAGVGSFSKRY